MSNMDDEPRYTEDPPPLRAVDRTSSRRSGRKSVTPPPEEGEENQDKNSRPSLARDRGTVAERLARRRQQREGDGGDGDTSVAGTGLQGPPSPSRASKVREGAESTGVGSSSSAAGPSGAGASGTAPRRLGTRGPGRAVPSLRIGDVGDSTGAGASTGVAATPRTDRSHLSQRSEGLGPAGGDGDGNRIKRRSEGETRFTGSDERINEEGGDGGDGDNEQEEEEAAHMGVPHLGVTYSCQADYVDPRKQLEAENTTLFTVTASPARLAVTNDAVKVLNERFRAHLDEGLYVGKTPVVAQRNRNRFEQRLLKETTAGKSSVRWFDKGGELEVCPDPVDYNFGKRSGHWYDPDAEYLQTKYLRPPRRIEGARIVSAEEKHYRLEMDVRDLTFYDHPLFTEEHYESRRLMITYSKYRARQELDLPNFYTDRLTSLRQELAKIRSRSAELVANGNTSVSFAGDPEQSMERSQSFSMSASFASTSHLKRGTTRAQSDEKRELHMRERQLRQDVSALRDLRDAEEYTDLLLVREIIATWGKIKKIRQEQGFVVTNTKLVIRRSRPEDNLDKIYDRDVEMEIEERREEKDEEFRQRYREYEIELSQWRARKKNEEERIRLLLEERATDKKLKSVRRRHSRGASVSQQHDPDAEDADLEQSRSGHAAADEDGKEDDEESDEEPIPHFNEPEPEEPVQEEFDEAAIREEIIERYRRTKRQPGEPVLDPVLTDTTPVTRAVMCSRQEQNRRAAQQKLKYVARVSVNGKFVDKTLPVTLTEDFRLQFRTIFSLQLAHWPDRVALDIHQQGVKSKKVCTVFVRFPGSEELFLTNAFPESFQFSSSEAFEPSYTPLVNQLQKGTGSAALPHTKHFTSGSVDVFMEWQGQTLKDENDTKPRLHPPIPRHKPPATDNLGKTGLASQLKLREWVKSANLDPNDPRNASIMTLLKTMEAAESIDTRFRITDQEKGLRFPYSDGPETRRHKLLRMREEKTVTNRQIPLFEHLIQDSMFDPPPNAASIEDKFKIDDKTPDFIKRIREKEIVRNLTEKQKLTTPDIVNEIPVPLFMSLAFLADIGKFLKPRRKLNPRRKTRRPKAKHLEKCELLIQVTRGSNVPVRSKMITGADLPEYPGAVQPTQDQYVATFVEVEFQGKRTRTHTTETSNPQWNELLSLPFSPPGLDFSSANLAEIRDEVLFSLYDEFVINNPKDDREQNSKYQRKEKRYLGSFRIPFQYLYTNIKVEGTFQFSKPIINMGYAEYNKYDDVDPRDGGAGRGGVGGGGGGGGGGPGGHGHGRTVRSVRDPHHSPTTVGLFLTFEPLLTKSDEPFGTGKEYRKYSDYALRWMHGLKTLKQCKDRHILCMASDIDNNPIALTRYIYPQAPPHELDTVEKVVRFVSMIPYLDDSVAFIRRNNLWTTSKQFLEILAGDAEEHAVLLTNYFLHMNRDAYLVLGTAMPDGETAYVMTKDKADGLEEKYTFWNPSTGESWDRWDPFLKLKSIGCIVTSENIYANIQSQGAPQLITLGLQDESAWRPFFTAQNPKGNKFITVQEELAYTPPPPTYARDLEEKINAAVIRNIENKRQRFVTSWNRACSRTLKALLPKFEEDRMATGRLSVEDHNLALGTILMSSHMNGFPVNVAYTDVNSVVQAVLDTGIADTEDENVEFATATYVYAYPNKVASVWVYICVLKNYD